MRDKQVWTMTRYKVVYTCTEMDNKMTLSIPLRS